VGLQIYKGGQGRYVRGATAVAAAVVDLVLCGYVWTLLEKYIPKEFAYKSHLTYGTAAAVFVVIGTVVYVYLNRPNVVDFLVATEAEMKKVSWSSRSELLGSTAVVIVTVVLLAAFIYVVDNLLLALFGRGIGLW